MPTLRQTLTVPNPSKSNTSPKNTVFYHLRSVFRIVPTYGTLVKIASSTAKKKVFEAVLRLRGVGDSMTVRCVVVLGRGRSGKVCRLFGTSRLAGGLFHRRFGNGDGCRTADGQKPYDGATASLSAFAGGYCCATGYCRCWCAAACFVRLGCYGADGLCRTAKTKTPLHNAPFKTEMLLGDASKIEASLSETSTSLSELMVFRQTFCYAAQRHNGCCGRLGRRAASRTAILPQPFSSRGCSVSPKRCRFRRLPKTLWRRLFCAAVTICRAIRRCHEPICRSVCAGCLAYRLGCWAAIRRSQSALRHLCCISFITVIKRGYGRHAASPKQVRVEPFPFCGVVCSPSRWLFRVSRCGFCLTTRGCVFAKGRVFGRYGALPTCPASTTSCHAAGSVQTHLSKSRPQSTK